MNAEQEKMYWELRQTKYELEQSLLKQKKKDWFVSVLEAELKDVQTAISKIEHGNYGHCEISGELISDDLLKMIPTLKSLKDSENIETFYKKPILAPFS
ncbi:hypothetical protein [Neobacillus kokaensis]|uniref:DksA C4-type domain-containing protein n=1 Tax=Neobacillus kokaensis TaxID=2759023 RepID=A0ABQ3MYL4_9BACI|nr:hypothetical protein [Neobacillus kokaensis]GHH96487.1 hypothetical protein AM1BK_00300 [Neobacillus kokaensis]